MDDGGGEVIEVGQCFLGVFDSEGTIDLEGCYEE